MKSPARILFVTHRYPPDLGGLSSSASRLSQQISKLGFDVDVLVLSRRLMNGDLQRDPEKIFNCGSLRVIRMGMNSKHSTSMMMAMNVVREMHSERRYDAIWGHYIYPNGFLACLLAREFGIRSTVSVRGNDLDTALFNKNEFSHVLWTLGAADLVSCVSKEYAQRIKSLSLNSKKTVVLGNAVDTEVFDCPEFLTGQTENSLDRNTCPPEQTLTIGFSGELREKKGLVQYLETFLKLNHVQPTHSLIVGEIRDSEKHIVDRMLTQYPMLQERWKVTGHFNDPQTVAGYYHQMDLLFLPSLWDGLPNSALEAMACGRIVLGTEVGGIREIIEDGQNGFLIAVSNLSMAADKIIEITGMAEAQKNLVRRAAREKILNTSSLETELAELASLMKGLFFS